MKKNLKTAMIFTGGLVGGIAVSGIATVKCVLKSDYIRNGIKDEISNKIITALYGDEYDTRRYDRHHMSYTNYYKKYYENDKTVPTYMYDGPVFNTRTEAANTLVQLRDILEQYGKVTMADYKDLCGSLCNYRDNTRGWVELKNAKITRVRDGYIIALPEPIVMYK